MEKIKNGITELVFILDRSGSMIGLEKETIGGFNSLIEQQKKQDGKCYVSTVLFDHETIVLHDREDLENVRHMQESDYVPRGMTALLDAVGDAIKHIGNIHKYARPSDVPEHTMFVITTDGMENSSQKYSAAAIKKLIGEKKKQGWEFLFLGANMDAVKTARDYGIDRERVANYRQTAEGTAKNFDAVCATVSCVRQGMPIAKNWSEKIDMYYNEGK